jgi:hypothetical protein
METALGAADSFWTLRGDAMPTDFMALLGVLVLAFPMACLLLSSPTFLLVGLEIPEVSQLLRGMIRGYFFAIVIAGVVSMVLLTAAGRPVFAAGAIVIAGIAIVLRRWLLQRMDAELQARDAGSAAAVVQLRCLHVHTMLINAIQLAIVVACVPLVV